MSNANYRGKSILGQNDEQTTAGGGGGGGGAGAARKLAAKQLASSALETTEQHIVNGTTTTNTITNAAQHQYQQQQPQTYLPQTSLLKIEPFVPSFNQRLRRRPIGRSYSTLSSTVIHKRNTSAGGGGGVGNLGKVTLLQQPQADLIVSGAVDGSVSPQQHLKQTYAATVQLQRQRFPTRPRGIVIRQRSKSTSSSATSNSCRPTTTTTTNVAALNGSILPASNNGTTTTATPPLLPTSNASGAIVQAQPNGICRITRTPKEREEMPDRINYDRRGLSAVPIFEQETHLRLLSLQHNLINIFHIPKEHTQTTLITNQTNPNKETKNEDQLIQATHSGHNNINNSNKHNPIFNSRHNRRHLYTNSNKNRLSLASPKSGSPTQATSPLNPQTLAVNGNGGVGGGGGRPKLLKRHSLLQKNFNFNNAQLPPASPTLQQQQQQQQQHQQIPLLQRFTLEKSKSFVSNYTRHLNSMKQQHNLNQRRALLLQARMRDSNKLKSFDSGASVTTTTTTDTTTASNLNMSEVSEEPESLRALEEQLSIKNKQLSLSASYGNIFQHLVFLDLYDNQIERIANIDGLPTLTVLLLGKNRITDITGLLSLRHTLRVLDLHGNKITSISNKINCLRELKSLNLAGNQIRQINPNDFNGLTNLKELNLKRNKIRRVNGFQHLTSLERLWLCHNDLHKVDDMATIAKATRLLEVSIENNPVSLAGDCVSFLVSYLPLLQTLSQMPITEQVRRAAMAWRQHKELAEAHSTAHPTSDVFNNIRREEVISNARTNWELLRSQQTVHTTALRPQRSPKKLTSELAKISESNENIACAATNNVEGTSSSSVLEELQALIKLPPIEQQQQQQQQHKHHHQQQQQQQQVKKERKDDGEDVVEDNSSDGSSLGPNVDSCSSCYSTDNEEKTNAASCKRAIHKQSEPDQATSTAAVIDENSNKLMLSSNGQTSSSKRNEPDKGQTKGSPQSTASTMNNNLTNGGGTGGSYLATTTTTIQLPPHGNGIERPTSSRQRPGVSAGSTRMPTTAINSNASSNQGLLNNKLSTTTNVGHGTVAAMTTSVANSTCRRYMHGSLMRAQTVACNSGGGVGRVSCSANRAANQNAPTNSYQTATVTPTTSTTTTNVVSIVEPDTAATSPTTNGNKTSPTTATTSATPLSTTSPTTTTTTTTATTSSTSSSLGVSVTITKPTATEREREQGGDYLIEICGRYLNIYGQGALRFIDKQWNPAKANDVHTLNFSYINFNNITTILGRIKVRFPNAENFVFRETNISCLGQLNALGELQGITTLYIDAEGNAITTKDLWRSYTIYRLSHWGLKQLNGIDVTEAEVEAANGMYSGLSDLVLWSMPDVMLQPLLARLRLDETCTASKMSPKEWLLRTDNKSLRLVVGKEALQWKKTAASAGGVGGSTTDSSSASNPTVLSTRERGRQHFALMMEHTCNAVEKLHKLEKLWPSMLLDIVRNTLLDYAQLDVYLRNEMNELMK